MDKIKEHLQREFDMAENIYWNLYEKVDKKERELSQLNQIVISLNEEKQKADINRNYYKTLLSEINNQ